MTRAVARGARRGSISRGWDSVTTVEKSAAELAASVGLDLPDRPVGGVPALPQDPTLLDDSGLMSLFTELTAWLAYANARFAVAEVEEQLADDSLDRVKAISTLRHMAEDEKTMTKAKARMHDDPEYLAAKAAVDEVYHRRKILGTLQDSIDRKVTLLSRELTRRVGREPREARAGRWSGA